LRTTITGRLADIEARGTDLGPATTARLQALLKQVQTINRNGYALINSAIKQELLGAGKFEVDFYARLIELSVGTEVAMVLPTATTLAAIVNSQPLRGRPLSAILSDLPRNATARINEAIRLGLVEGQTSVQITRNIFGTAARGFDDGIQRFSRRGMQMVINTAVNHTMTRAREALFEQNRDLIGKVMWVSTLDSRTTPICVLGKTHLNPTGLVEKVFRRKYRGEVVIITTASGKELIGTPEHPVLTSRGWTPMNEIEPDNEVVYTVLDDCSGVDRFKDVHMPPTAAQIFDASLKPPFVDVFRGRAAARELDRCGMGLDDEVDIINAKSPLWLTLYLRFLQHRKYGLLSLVHDTFLLAGYGLSSFLFRGFDVVVKTAKFSLANLQKRIQGRSGYTNLCDDLGGTHSRIVERQNQRTFGAGKSTMFTTPECWHDTELFQRCRNSRSGAFELPSYFSGGDTVTIQPDNVVDVRREFRTEHVYNLQTSTHVYIANGIIVHNCMSRDKSLYPVGKGPRPPAHPSCRSTTVPILKGETDLLGERASAVGGVPAETDYEDFLRRIQDDPAALNMALNSKQRAKLFRDGGLSLDDLIDDRDSTFFTLEELKENHAGAFEKAGLPL